MPRIVESSKKRHSDNSFEKRDSEDEPRRCTLSICAEEDAYPDKDIYILGLCGTQSELDLRVAAAFSNYSCAVYTVGESLAKLTELPCNDSPVVGIKFSHSSKHILYTATRDGIITVSDLRAKGKITSTIKDSTPDGKSRPFASFDVSHNDRLVVAGSEHVGGDAFILFWDLRYNNARTEAKSDLLGGYWESHMDDVTALAFHPKQTDILASGSTDGLINIFDLTKSNEDSALNNSLNTESSVDRVNWLDNGNLWCTTHTHEVQFWDSEDAEPQKKFDRNAVGAFIHSDLDTSYVVKMHNSNACGQPFLIAGSTSGNGKLCGLSFVDDNFEVCYDLIGNKQLVRDSYYHEKSDLLITGGERGIINVWKESDSVQSAPEHNKSSAKFGGKARDKQPRAKPY